MSRLIFMASAAALALTALPADAQSFEGFTVGVGVGGARLSVDEPIAGSTQRLDKAHRSAGYRVFTGYDFRVGDAVVLGAEFGVNFGGKDIKQTIGGVDYTADVQSQADLTARAGYVFGESLLIYGRAGLGRISDYAVRSGATSRKTKKDESGAVYGVGAEYSFGEHWGIRGEYTRFDGPKNLNRDQVLISALYHF